MLTVTKRVVGLQNFRCRQRWPRSCRTDDSAM